MDFGLNGAACGAVEGAKGKWRRLMLKLHQTRFPETSPWTGKLPTCSQQSWQQVGVEVVVIVMEFGKRHEQQTQRTFSHANLLQACYGLVVYVVDLLRICYG